MASSEMRSWGGAGITGVNIAASKKNSKLSKLCAINYVLAPCKRAPESRPFIWSKNKKLVAFDQRLWDQKGKKTKKSTKGDLDEKEALVD